MTKTLVQTYTFAYEYRRNITAALLTACAACGIFYAVNMYRAISHSVSLDRTGKEIAAADAAIRALDRDYVGISGTITPDILRFYGFNKADVSAFISRTASLGLAQTGYGL